MDHAKFAELSAWLTEAGLAGESETALLDGLHIGEVFYGNIGSDERLDFTVSGRRSTSRPHRCVGPSSAMC